MKKLNNASTFWIMLFSRIINDSLIYEDKLRNILYLILRRLALIEYHSFCRITHSALKVW